MTERKLDNIDESAEDLSLGDVLRTLKRVDAPSDFGFKVKARIAEGDPDNRGRRGWWPLPVYVYPLLILLVVAAAFIFFYRPGGEQPQAIAKSHNAAPANDLRPMPENPGILIPNGNVDPGIVTAASPERTRSNVAAPQGGSKDSPLVSPPGGSRDSALGNPQQILPPGFNVNAKRPVGPPPVGNGQSSISAILGFMGLDSKFEGQALKVTSVRVGSIAEKTGFKAGDVVESIDGKPVSSMTKTGTSFEAKSFTVRRGDQTVRLEIRAQ